MKRKNRLIVLSADALVKEDLDHLRTLPNFRRYLAGGSAVESVRTIYPTVTYPAHVSISTGTYPNRHGVTSNFELHAGNRTPPWNWFHHVIRVPDLFSAAKAAGLSTAAVFWPVSGNHPDIDYLVTEYWTQHPGDTLRDVFRRSGSSPEVMEIVEKHSPVMVERTHPMCDEFVIGCACDIIRRFTPDLLMIHPANIDAYRHGYGLFNEKVTRGIEETDRWIGEVMQAAEDAGVLESTNLFLVSDHGQLDIKRVMHPNVMLADRGHIRVKPDGSLLDWDAYCLSGGMSALVYLKDPSNVKLHQTVYSLLLQMRDEGIYGISEVFTQEEINRKERLGGDFSFVLETDGFSAFGDNWQRPITTTFDLSDYRYGRATHGYLPDKGPQPVLVARGPAVRENVVIDRGLIVDEGPTFAKLLGFSLPHADGSPMEAILR